MTQTLSPSKAKYLGRSHLEYLISKDNRILDAWELLKYSAMISVLVSKFRGECLGGKLEQTKDLELIETNPSDIHWGSGLNNQELERFVQERTNHREMTENDWGELPGDNLCGQALMEVRDMNRHGTSYRFLVYTGPSDYFALNDNDPSNLTFCSSNWVPATFKLRVAQVIAHEYMSEVVIEFSLHEFLPPNETRPPEVVQHQLLKEVSNLSNGPKSTIFLFKRMPWALSGSTGSAALQQSALAWDGAFGHIRNAFAAYDNIKWEGSFSTIDEPPTREQEKELHMQENYDPADPTNQDPSNYPLHADDETMGSTNQDVTSTTSPVKQAGGTLLL